MTDDRFRLTRRKILGSVGAVGLAGAGAGLGTSALFSDEEEFEGNTLTAGTLNLKVSADIAEKSPETPNPQFTPDDADAADGTAVTITWSDVKPGDWIIIEWNAEVFGNPGYVQVTSVDDDYANNEGANTEPETDTSPPGDLGDALLSTIWLAYNDMNTSRTNLEGLDDTGNLAGGTKTGHSWDPSRGEGGNVPGASDIHYTTANEAHDQYYKDGVLLRDTSGNPLEVGTNPDGEGAFFYQLLELPVEVGNEVQGDELVFTLRFESEQVRNNSDPF